MWIREIGINTLEQHKRRDYATISCAKFIQKCEKQGLQSFWNYIKFKHGSVALDRKLGYQTEKEYWLLIWNKKAIYEGKLLGFMNIEYQQDKFSIDTDREMLNIDFIHDYLCNQSYWAQGRSREVVEKSIQNSLCFGVFDGEQQVGFARIVTDYTTFAWLCDVFIVESHRGLGLGKWLVKSVISHPEIASLKYILLATSNAHELYRKYGDFEALRAVNKWMVRYSGT